MDDDEVAPVPLHRVQRTRLAPQHGSFRTQVLPARYVHDSVDYDIVAVLLPPESSPSSIPSTPRAHDATKRRGRPPGARCSTPHALPWTDSSSPCSAAMAMSPATSRQQA